MYFDKVVGQEHIKNYLINSITNGRIPHAQIFVGPHGSGTLPMALAYAKAVICGTIDLTDADKKTNCDLKIQNYNHPDLHFTYPIASAEDGKRKDMVSSNYIKEWLTVIQENPYLDLMDWYNFLEIPKKNAEIAAREANEINKKLSLKAFDGGYKVMVIWMAEKMNTVCANKLLKLLEEPPAKTVFLLVVENISQLMNTIVSRCQVVDFIGLTHQDISQYLQKEKQIDEKLATKIALQANGNLNKALHLLNQDDDTLLFDQWFITWVRAAFRAKGNAAVISNLIKWSEEIAKESRQKQVLFLQYCTHFFRQALLLNYQSGELVYLEPSFENFDLKKFAPFIHGNNILPIFNTIEEAIAAINSNVNSNIVFTDLSIKLTRFIHLKPN
jgi:DNA polymerase III subunit delta'